MAIENLNNLIEETNAEVVISSTWRLGNSLFYLKHLFAEAGFIGNVIGLTPKIYVNHEFPNVPRGYEIQAYLKCNYDCCEDVRYIIFDDDSDMLYNQRHNYIQIDGAFGLSHNHCYRAKNKLNHINFF